ncbi:sulfatase [soil metagenome]
MRIFHPLILAFAITAAGIPSGHAAEKPDVLFIAIDDLNHWVGHLGRNPQTITPHLDRLAERGITFTRAYCVAPACNPSRAALMGGMLPSSTGIYHNPDDWKVAVRPEQTLNSHFRSHGYFAAGAGKIYHGGGGRLEEWDDYSRDTRANDSGAYSESNYGGIRWSVLKGGDDAVRDYFTVSYCIEQLSKEHEKPLFLACGIFRPHMPWSVPKKYFDMHPLDEIQLPPFREDDLADIPPAGRRMARPGGDHANLTAKGAWKEAVQAYLASITYADAMLGRLLDALDKSPRASNTVIVLWGDHGWHLGEKSHWRKFALWEEATRAPLIWVAPGVTQPGTRCDTPIDFLNIYPTLCDLAGLPIPAHVEGVSLRPMLADPATGWDRPALTIHGYKNFAVRKGSWRYIRYEDGTEELYDHRDDPYEWDNLAADPQHAALKAELAEHFPKTNVRR